MIRRGLFAVLALWVTAPAVAQVPANSRYGNGDRMPLAPVPEKGEPIAPFFEGWYRNDDGTFTFSFGYFNLSGNQEHDIPVGENNFIEPAEFNGVQPTYFPADPRRDRGVFHVTVPASWEETREEVVWTITANEKTASVPARVGFTALQLDYLPRAMGSLPPLVRTERDGEPGQGIVGVWAEPMQAMAGEPLLVTIWGEEISPRLEHDVVNTSVYLTALWVKHQGPPGAVTFSPQRIKIETGNGRATTNVTFAEPGEYVIRARVDNGNANDSSAGDQCCWSNVYVPVTVTGG